MGLEQDGSDDRKERKPNYAGWSGSYISFPAAPPTLVMINTSPTDQMAGTA